MGLYDLILQISKENININIEILVCSIDVRNEKVITNDFSYDFDEIFFTNTVSSFIKTYDINFNADIFKVIGIKKDNDIFIIDRLGVI